MLAACAGNSPSPSNNQSTSPNLLASWSTGKIEKAAWENWKQSTGLSAQTPESELAKQFNEYVRMQLDGQAAIDAGLNKDKAKADRWASITERILADKLRRDFLTNQLGFTDSAIQKWAAGQDSTIRKLPMDSLRLRGGRALALVGIKLDSVYSHNKESFKIDSVHFKPIDSVKSMLEDLALRGRTEKLMATYVPDLRTRYDIKTVTPVRPEPNTDTLMRFWNANKDRWMTTATYRIVALGSKDSTKLAKALSGVKNLEAFKKLASKFPIGAPVAPNGVLGRIKSQFALPYGIGMAPGLFPALDTGKVGAVLPVLRANDSLFVATWMEAKDSAVVKPFASVKDQVRSEWTTTQNWVPPATAVLATWDKGALFTQADVMFVSEEIPPNMRRQFPAERVLDFMLNWKVSARNAQEIGLDVRPEIQSLIADNQKMYWAQEWRQNPQYAMFLFDKKQADSATTAWKDSLFSKDLAVDSSGGANRDGARLCLMGKNRLHETYLIDIDKYRRDSAILSYDSARASVFSDLRPVLDQQGRERIDSSMKARYGFKIHPAAPQAPAPLSFAAAFDSARAAHDRRSLEQAEALYRQVENDAQGSDSVRAQALFQLGQLFGEQQSYPRSLSSYRSVLVRYPKSNEAYKAQFMIAFTYSEYLKNEKAALVEYGKMLTEYPKSDLSDDADWMIRNIKSGGALMPKFDDSAFVADSIARADSVKKSAGLESSKKDVATPAAKAEPAKAPPAAKPAAAVSKPDTAKTLLAAGKKTSAKNAAKVDTATAKAKAVSAKTKSTTKVDSVKAGSKK